MIKAFNFIVDHVDLALSETVYRPYIGWDLLWSICIPWWTWYCWTFGVRS